jgi:putative ABC transport system substrate-binding protein
LVNQGVDVIVATGGDYSIKAAIVATSTIPIVFTTGNDPVAAGYVKSLRQPGGNATGVTFLASSLEAKRLEMLHEIDPKATSVAVLIGPADARAESDIREIEGAAKSLALSVRFVKIRSEDDIIPAFKDITAHRDNAIHIATDPFFFARARTLAALAHQFEDCQSAWPHGAPHAAGSGRRNDRITVAIGFKADMGQSPRNCRK